jgi:succinyldiaminopimelate transaminase
VPLSPVLRQLDVYPFARLTQEAARRRSLGLEVIDLGVGDPREPTDERIIAALKDGLRERMGYPAAVGLPELREAIAGWIDRRFGVLLDADRHVIPTLGSKEAIFSFALIVLDRPGGKDTVVITDPGYPVPARGAAVAGGRVFTLPLREEHGFLPDLASVPPEIWARTALLWLNYPNNPTAVVAPLELYAHAAALAREHDFVLASDEAYSELWSASPPPSALQLPDLSNVVVFNTLSKRSSMTGFRSGFVAGDVELIDALKRFRPATGTAPQEFVQRASVVAWSDEEHVAAARATYLRKRDVFREAIEDTALREAGGDATMFMWLAMPDGVGSDAFATELLESGLLVAPGTVLGTFGEGYARLALVATDEECERAAAIIARVAG